MIPNEITQRCPGCMRPLKESPVCPDCGTPAQFVQSAPFLPLRTLLAQGRIGIGCAVEQNGDGITYLGFDEQARKPVYVREFFPAAIALREQGQLVQAVMQGCETVWHDCAQNFTELWRKLQRLRGLSALLAVTDVFEENGTVFAVYEYTECMTLREFLLRGKLGYISWDRARALLMPVLSTLGNLHQQGIIHRGISPNTLYFGADGKVRIGGFSIWQARTAHGDLTAELLDGYAALEQYGLDGQQGAWTDIYAFAAVLYRSLIGSDPEDAVSRRHNDRVMVPAHFAERIPAYVINALINAMQIFPEDRTRSVEHLRAELSASPTAVAQSAPMRGTARIPHATAPIPRAPEKTQPKQPKSSTKRIALRTTGIILVAGTVLILGAMAVLFREQIAVAFGFYSTTEAHTQTTGTTVQQYEVPFFVGRQFTEGLAEQYEGKLTLVAVYEHDEFVPAGQIIRQAVAEGKKVDMGAELVLTVSDGKPTAELPKIVGKEIAQVRETLEALGFVVTVDIKKNDGKQKENTVKAVFPAEGGTYTKETEIFVQVWGPIEVETTTEAVTETDSDTQTE